MGQVAACKEHEENGAESAEIEKEAHSAIGFRAQVTQSWLKELRGPLLQGLKFGFEGLSGLLWRKN